VVGSTATPPNACGRVNRNLLLLLLRGLVEPCGALPRKCYYYYDFHVEADETEEIDFEKIYQVKKDGAIRVEIFVKQHRMLVWENETWLQIQDRIAE
jgi:hypothetical protein